MRRSRKGKTLPAAKQDHHDKVDVGRDDGDGDDGDGDDDDGDGDDGDSNLLSFFYIKLALLLVTMNGGARQKVA